MLHGTFPNVGYSAAIPARRQVLSAFAQKTRPGLPCRDGSPATLAQQGPAAATGASNCFHNSRFCDVFDQKQGRRFQNILRGKISPGCINLLHKYERPPGRGAGHGKLRYVREDGEIRDEWCPHTARGRRTNRLVRLIFQTLSREAFPECVPEGARNVPLRQGIFSKSVCEADDQRAASRRVDQFHQFF